MSVTRSDWISRAEAATILGIHDRLIPAVVLANGVRVRKVPGHIRTSYHREDIERVDRESVGIGAAPEARQGTPPTPAPPATRTRATGQAAPSPKRAAPAPASRTAKPASKPAAPKRAVPTPIPGKRAAGQ